MSESEEQFNSLELIEEVLSIQRQRTILRTSVLILIIFFLVAIDILSGWDMDGINSNEAVENAVHSLNKKIDLFSQENERLKQDLEIRERLIRTLQAQVEERDKEIDRLTKSSCGCD